MKRIDSELWLPFVKQWEEAAGAGMTVEEFAQLLGLPTSTVASRQIALRKRGVTLTPMRGQRGPRGPYRRRRTHTEAERASEPRPVAFEPLVLYVM